MLLTFSKIRKAIAYNARRAYPKEVIEQIQMLVGARPTGRFSRKTVEAVALWQEANNLDIDGKIGPNTMKAMEPVFPPSGQKPNPPRFVVEPDPELEPEVIDRTKQGRKALRRKSRDQNKRYKGHPRSGAGVNGIVLHQMGFSRGNKVSKYHKVTAHFIITPDGRIAQLHDVTESLYSSNYLNNTTVAVEFVGNLRNHKGRWHGTRSPDSLTPKQVAAGRYLLKHVKETYGIDKVWAHRQGTGTRRANCCGPEIWRNIAEYAIDPNGLGFVDTRNQTMREGLPIPKVWRV